MTQKTIQTFKFPWAGDPWIYNGTCLLFRFLKNLLPEETENMQEKFSDVTWNVERGIINAPTHKRFLEFLDYICDLVVHGEYRRDRNKDILYLPDEPIEKRFITFPRPALSLFHSRLYTTKNLTEDGKELSTVKVSIGELSTEEIEVLKKIVEEENSKIHDNKYKLNPFKKTGGTAIYTKKSKLNISPFKKFKSKPQRCDFCGEERSIRDITGLDHPLMITPGKYQNFFSNLKGKVHICDYCSTSTLFTSCWIPYLISNDTYFYALPQITGLKEGIEFWDLLTTQTGGELLNEWCNFESDSWRYDSTHLAFLALLTFVEEKFRIIRERVHEDKELREKFPDLAEMSDEELWKLTCKSWTTVYGDGLIPRIVNHYHSTPKLYRLIRRLREEKIELKTFVSSFTYKQTGGDYVTRFKDELAKRILDFRAVNLTIEAFLNDATSAGSGHSIWGLSKFLKIYNTEVMKMKESEINKAISIGLRIGKYCKNEEDKDLLYELRSCTNRTQFLEFLDRATFKIPELRVGKEFILSLTDDNWADQKSIVGIYAHQTYYEGQPKSQGGEEE